jgi:dTDP-4-dehydrorhamnose 3,5-epimerase
VPQDPKTHTSFEIIGADQNIKDSQTVYRDGSPVFTLIEGVLQRIAVTQADERGTLCEIFNPAWDFDDRPIVYVYQSSLLPGYAKGWVVHREQDDRLFFALGRMRLVLFDGRTASPTFRTLNRFEVGQFNRCLIRIPAGVYHAVQNIGTTEAWYYNLPTKPYCHENPDKFRLPLDTDIIPYRFENIKGW